MIEISLDGYTYDDSDDCSPYDESNIKEKEIKFFANPDGLAITVDSVSNEDRELRYFVKTDYDSIQLLKAVITYMEAVYIKGDDE